MKQSHVYWVYLVYLVYLVYWVCVWTLSCGLLGACNGSIPEPKEGDPCDTIRDCAPTKNLACSVRTCQKLACTRSAQCPTGAACVEGTCSLPECLVDHECANNGVCFEGDCRDDLCTTHDECSHDHVCRGTPPQCMARPEFCVRDEDCPNQTQCKTSTGSCLVRCGSDAACSGTDYCDGTFCRALCIETSQCAQGEFCIQERCAPLPDCTDAPPCPQAKPFRDITNCACVACRSDEDCDASRLEACIEKECSYCPIRSDEDVVCQAQGLVRSSSCCVHCRHDADCNTTRGESCQEGRCIDEYNPSCMTDRDCPKDTRCDGDRCVTQSSGTSCTTQSECPQGQACYADGTCRVEGNTCAIPCLEPLRCVAELGDARGVCAGCNTTCDAHSCPENYVCLVPSGAHEGYCADQSFFGTLCL